MSVENIVAKISADSESECAQIKAAAEKRAADLGGRLLREAEEKAKEILAQADFDIEEINRRQSLIAELESRKSELAARRRVLDEVFALAEEKLNKLPRDKWEEFVAGCVKSGCETGEEELCVPAAEREKYLNGFLSKLNQQLLSDGKRGNLRLSDAAADFSGGVLVVGKSGDWDASFPALLKNARAKCEKAAADILFKAEV
jgi:V/A-type H+-transporting ATPase subunit E